MSERPLYAVRFTRQAEKELEKLRRHGARALTPFAALAAEPESRHPLRGSLLGARSLEFSLPGGAYRAAYVLLPAERACLVFIVGPHENFYRDAERRYEALKKTLRAGEDQRDTARRSAQ